MNRFGPYRLIRPLTPIVGWERWLALHEIADTDHVVYRHPAVHDAAERRRLLAQVAPLASVRHPHLLEIEAYSFDDAGRLCMVTTYTGNQEGLVTLEDLSQRRSGRLDATEVARCVEHLLEGVDAGRRAGLSHGRIDPERVLVDRRGSLRVELFGLPRADAIPAGNPSENDEVRSVAELAVWLLTGLPFDLAPASLSRIAGKSVRGLEAWIRAAIDPIDGYDSAAAALGDLPARTDIAVPFAQPTSVRPKAGFSTVLRRFRREARDVPPDLKGR